MASLKPFLPLLRPLGGTRVAASRHILRFSTSRRHRDESNPSKPIAQAIKPSTSIPSVPPQAPSTPKDAARAADLAAAEAVTDADSAQPVAPKPSLPSKRPKTSRPAPPSQQTSSLDSQAVSAAPDTPQRTFPSKRPGSDKPRDSTKPGKGANPEAPSKAERQLSAPNVVKPTIPRKKGTTPMKISLPPARYHVAKSSKQNYSIYTDYKRGGNLHLTLIRKITGDLSALRDELKIYLNKKEGDVKVNQLTKQVIVKGHHVSEVQQFLRARGM